MVVGGTVINTGSLTSVGFNEMLEWQKVQDSHETPNKVGFITVIGSPFTRLIDHGASKSK